ncbi:HAD-IA family hydrolase [Nicoliella spurrieriana]|uniref:HAD-IA family hydrolase n=1 Tax=Nicoliella spurrieriana TaxID=2925830 RepID=A0A976RRY8_9LACO|nr:HAD-IA family hydrolase [Nicoliella spurrieriana]UQS86526.1 HAD-IA family hydrolase [Nicoliella spurrieriana]
MRSLFWDFDGTLFNTYPMMVRAFDETLQLLGIDEIEMDDQAYYEEMRRHSAGSAISRFAAEFNLSESEIRPPFKKLQDRLVMDSQPFPGAIEVLKWNVANDGQNFLLTHRDSLSLSILDRFKIKGLFTDFITSEQSFPRKPNPGALNYLIDKYSINRDHAVMIGDRKLDIEAGHNANIDGYLFDPDGIIRTTGNPEARVPLLTELLPALKRL